MESDHDRRLRVARTLAFGTLGAGFLGVYTSYLANRGYQHAAANLSIAIGLTGTILGAVQIYTLYTIGLAPAAAPPATEAPVQAPRPDEGKLAALGAVPYRYEVFGHSAARSLRP